MTINFQQILTSSLYQVQPGDTGGWCGYLLAPSETNPNQPLSLDQAFTDQLGTFLFAPTAPVFSSIELTEAFVDAIQKWLTNPNGDAFGRFCVWLPSAQPEQSSPVVFGSDSYFTDTNDQFFAFQFSLLGSSYKLKQNMNVQVGTDFSLAITNSVYISVGTDSLALFSPMTGMANGMFFQGPQALYLSIHPQSANIPLTGNLAGCITLGGNIAIHPLQEFLIGMQFAYHDSGADVVVQGFPSLDTHAEISFDYVASFDPLDPFCTGAASRPSQGIYRTILAAAYSAIPVALPSQYRTSFNQSVALLPNTSKASSTLNGPTAFDGGFIFQPTTALAFGSNTLPVMTKVYLAPAGDFSLVVSGASTSVSLLCGLSGTETLQLLPAGGTTPPDILRFVGSMPAYTPQYPLPTTDLSNPSSGQSLSPLPVTNPLSYITSWAQAVAGGGTPTYSSQPQGNTLFGPAGAYGDGHSVVGALQPMTPVSAAEFPLPAWAGMGVNSTLPVNIPVAGWADYESRVLATARRNAIQALARLALHTVKSQRFAARALTAEPAAVVANGTTPQGLLAQLDMASGVTVYDAVVLAQSVDGTQMAFYDLDAEMQGLFQTNQLFAVITDPTHLGKFANSVDIDGWMMQAMVGEASASSNVSNVLIFKFCVGTLLDLVAKPSAWVDTADFSNPDPNSGVAVLSQALQIYINTATANAKDGNALYANFAAIANDASWQGILVLGGYVSPSDLPPQLAGLAAGIDFNAFRAHHFGVTVSPVRYDGSTLSIPGGSSFFALVDYQLAAYSQNLDAGASPTQPLALPNQGMYGFTVLQLQALFNNSVLTDFNSHVQVTLNQVFSSAVIASYSNGGRLASNSVVLTGTYQDQGGVGSYLFESDANTVMVPDSNVLDSVVLTKMMFNTLTANDGGTPPQILSRILIWGRMNFAVLQSSDTNAFDIMSYGMPSGSTPQSATGGLAFSNLYINMSSPVASPNMVTYRIIEDSIAFDQSSSLLRPDSTVSDLAMQPQSFVVATTGTTPANLGFLPVMLSQPAPPQSAITTQWYGISCLVNMGGPGALASAAGFTSHLLLGWSPQSKRGVKSYAAFVGLQLPGASPGASSFSLQGVLNLTVGNISMSLAPVAGSDETAFTLCLGNISLSFLGIAKLPSSASIDMYLFGDPGGAGSLGWYAAYVENPATSVAVPLISNIGNIPS
jgi:hypothetical protein